MKSWTGSLAVLAAALVIVLPGVSRDARAADTPSALTSAAAINKAGRQRMLSQRLAKAYLMVALGVQADEGRRILSRSLTQFDLQLAELKTWAPNEDIRAAAAALEREWKPYRAVLSGTPDLRGAQDVYGMSDTVLDAAHRLTLACERASDKPAARALLISGRERMLSQRLAKYYLFMRANLNTPAARMEFRMTRGEFVQGLAQLAASPLTTPALKSKLEKVSAEWLEYERALGPEGSGGRASAPEVAARSERILELLEDMVAGYEAGA
jgi:nitrate/nitrite-specific signal transduction histidine kinase